MIVILGDSWGVGEWGVDDNNCYCLTGPGISQYISMHDTVINLSVGAGSNTESLNRLENLLKKYRIDAFDTIYCIVTDPLRCLTSMQPTKFQTSIAYKVGSLLNNFLSRANDIGKQHQTVINLIGGLCDLNSIDILNYSYLNIAVPSWGKLLDKNYNASWYSYSNTWDLIGNNCTTSASKLEWINLTKLCDDKTFSMKKLFITNSNHPDRYDHRVLRDFLFPNWKHTY